MLLKDKKAVITGCNRGIGFALLEVFSKHGAQIIACIRKDDQDFKKKVKEISQKNNNKIEIVYFDLEKENEIEKGFQQIKTIFPRIDILINNAGINQISLFQMTTLKTIKRVFEVNFFSVVSFTQKILKILSKNTNSNCYS